MAKQYVLEPKSFVMSDWSGGKTKELYLFPPTSRYLNRDFEFRLSTASVSLEETTFSDLSGYHRIIMTLDHPMTLINHTSHKTVDLHPFQAYYFEGSDRIRSIGKCTDFNFIFNDDYCGKLMAITSNNDPICNSQSIQMVYSLCDVTYQINYGDKQMLKANHLLVIEKEPPKKACHIQLTSEKQKDVAIAVWAGLSYRRGFGLHDERLFKEEHYYGFN